MQARFSDNMFSIFNSLLGQSPREPESFRFTLAGPFLLTDTKSVRWKR